MAARADVAIVAIRRPTGTFSGAGVGAAGGVEDGESAVGASVTSATAGAAAAAAAAAGDSAPGRAAYGQPAGAAATAGAAGGLGWDPLCQVRARITWVGES
jgi:hypothetical protein